MHKNSFLGIGWEFPPSFDEHSKSVDMVCDEQDIKESLMILLGTTPGERPMEPTYGCDLSPLAFQSLDLNLETFMTNNIKKAILNHEPRIHVNNIQLESNTLEGIINISVNYTIKTTNSLQNMIYPYYLAGQINI